MIGDEITLTVLAISGNQARLGIDAPKSTSVHREEVFLRLKEQSLRGSTTGWVAAAPKK